MRTLHGVLITKEKKYRQRNGHRSRTPVRIEEKKGDDKKLDGADNGGVRSAREKLFNQNCGALPGKKNDAKWQKKQGTKEGCLSPRYRFTFLDAKKGCPLT